MKAAVGPTCPGPTCPGPTCPGPTCPQMNKDVQAKIAILENKGWTLASIARELGLKPGTVESWKAGTRSPTNLKLVLEKLDELIKRNRIPPKKIYAKGSRVKNSEQL